jgi:hypothetical protein
LYTTSAAVLHGHSGGAVVSPSGAVVAIVASCAMMESSRVVFHHVNYCLPVEALLPLLKGLPPQVLAVPGAGQVPALAVSAEGLSGWARRLQEDSMYASAWRLAVPKAPGRPLTPLLARL